MATELLEREAEQAVLASAVEQVTAGDGGRLLMVLGEAGIGKTALLAVVDELARAADIATFRAAGAPRERDFGYGIVRQLLERELRSRSPEERARLLTGASATAAAVFGLPDREAPLVADPDRSLAVRHALVLLVGELAREHPVPLILDDLHWADGATLRWLAHLARRLDEVPALIVSAARTGEPGEEDAVLGCGHYAREHHAQSGSGSVCFRLPPADRRQPAAGRRAIARGARRRADGRSRGDVPIAGARYRTGCRLGDAASWPHVGRRA